MKPLAILGAGVVAILGAIAWGLISRATGYEVGYVAWGIGLLIGLAAVALGSRGKSNGLVCAVFALLAIAGGKYLAVEMAMAAAMQGEMRQEMQNHFNRAMYDEMVAEAGELDQLSDDATYAKFMVDHQYSESEPTSEEIEWFKKSQEPELRQMSNGDLTFEQWQSRRVDTVVEMIRDNTSTLDVLKDSLSPFDLLWVFLGVTTAYRIGGRGEEQVAEPVSDADDNAVGNEPQQTA